MRKHKWVESILPQLKRVREWAKKVLSRLKKLSGVVMWLMFVVGSVVIPIFTAPNWNKPETKPLITVQTDITDQKVEKVELNTDHDEATVTLKDGKKYLIAYPKDYGTSLTNRLMDAKVPVNVSRGNPLERLQWMFLAFTLVLIAPLTLRKLGGAIANIKTGATGSDSKKVSPIVERPKERFSDVAGVDEVIAGCKQDVDFLQNPARYEDFGVVPNEGILLHGPSGTGKTLLARAIAGEAGVPFFSAKGSDLMGRWANHSPLAVRAVFDEARKHAPAILFIDEGDSVASKRSSNDDSGTKEHNNTLNELLAQLDGFDQTAKPLLVIMATNRKEDLDPAVLRPGRLTRHFEMPAPDMKGRRSILELHMAKLKKLAEDVDVDLLVRLTSGMTGADLGALVNQAGLIALAENNEAAEVTMTHFQEAVETARMGVARKSRVVLERDRAITAVHEAGHALVALFTEGAPTPTRITIVPRGSSGGHTGTYDEEWLFLTLGQLKARLAVSMAGRASEKLMLDGDFTTGAESDIEYATNLARYMVCQVGMGSVYTARVNKDWDELSAEIAAEVNTLVQEAEASASRLLTAHKEDLVRLRDHLLEVETLDGEKLKAMFPRDAA